MGQCFGHPTRQSSTKPTHPRQISSADPSFRKPQIPIPPQPPPPPRAAPQPQPQPQPPPPNVARAQPITGVGVGVGVGCSRKQPPPPTHAGSQNPNPATLAIPISSAKRVAQRPVDRKRDRERVSPPQVTSVTAQRTLNPIVVLLTDQKSLPVPFNTLHVPLPTGATPKIPCGDMASGKIPRGDLASDDANNGLVCESKSNASRLVPVIAVFPQKNRAPVSPVAAPPKADSKKRDSREWFFGEVCRAGEYTVDRLVGAGGVSVSAGGSARDERGEAVHGVLHGGMRDWPVDLTNIVVSYMWELVSTLDGAEVRYTHGSGSVGGFPLISPVAGDTFVWTRDRVVARLSDVLHSTFCTRPYRQALNDGVTHNSTFMFQSKSAPISSIRDYMKRIAKYTGISGEALVMGMVHVARVYSMVRNFPVNVLTLHRLFLTAAMLSAKFFDDTFVDNARWALVGGVSSKEMNMLEVEFLFLIDFNLHITKEEYTKVYYHIMIDNPNPITP